MTPGEQAVITYATHHFCNPLSPETLDRVLAFAGLQPGQTAIDVGCGNGLLSLHLAERYGLHVDASDIAPEMIALAQERILGRGRPGSVALRVAAAASVLDGEARPDLLVANGVWGLVEGRPEPDRILRRLAEAARPGGHVLWGEVTFAAPPPPRLAMVFQAADYRSHAAYLTLAQAAGLTPVYAATSPEADVADYFWRGWANALAWARANPGHPARDTLLQRAQVLRTLYDEEGRGVLGFGLYLLRTTAVSRR